MDKVTRNRTRGRGLARAALAGVVAVALLVPVVPASASEPPEGTSAAKPAVRQEAPWAPGNKGMAVWFWPEGNRAYQLNGFEAGSIRAYDTSTDMATPVAEGPLDPRAWGMPDFAEFWSSNGRHHSATVDRENGRVFVAYATKAEDANSTGQRRAAFLESPCPYFSSGVNSPVCVGGVHVLDAGSLEPLGRIPLQLPSAESPRVQASLKALEYMPAVPERGWGGRVLMLVDEQAPNTMEGGPVSNLSSAFQNATPRRGGANIAYAVSLDPETMRQEWAVRVEGCRNSREQRTWMQIWEGHPSTIFRTAGDDPALYVGCHGNASQQGVVVRVPLDADGVPAGLPVRVGDPVSSVDPDADDAGLSQVAAPAPRQEVFAGPDKVTVMLADPASQRILMRVDDSGEVWWVFDAHVNQFLGTIGIGSYAHGHTTYGLDPDTGRLYVVAAPPLASEATNGPGGLYIADIRRNPLAQALHYPDLADPPRDDRVGTLAAPQNHIGRAMSVMPRGGGDEARIYITKEKTTGAEFRVLVDGSPVSMDSPPDDGGIVRTLDIPESEGVTAATFDGTARGFGFRTILMGGVEGATRAGPADPVGLVRGVPQFESQSTTGAGDHGKVKDVINPVPRLLPRPDGCSDTQRELVVAFVGPRGAAVVDASSARGEAQPVVADVRTQGDVGQPVTRCLPVGWQELWESALVSRPPMGEPGVAWPFDEATSSCTATEEEQSDSWSDPVIGAFSSEVKCSEDEAGGWGQARGIGLDGVSVADTLSSFRIYLDPERGMVARVESIARGVNIGGIARIDTIRGSAESWANGHLPAEEPAAVDEGVFNPFNCDTTRPAGTCFQRHIFGVTVTNPATGGTGYKCGPCGDEDALIEGLNRGFGAYASARFRQPDRDLARGSADGYLAAITKKSQERFADIVMNADLLETMVPMLEVIRYAPHNRPSDKDYSFGTPPRARQVYQFAAVEVSSTYSIQCLLVYDEATNTCSGEKQEPGAITVSLSDSDGKLLAGGAFEVRADVDADGVLGLKDTLLPAGACVTADDGVGTCELENLQPGGYLVTQTAAPAGYAKAAEPYLVELASGEARTVAFTNVSNVSTVELKAQDEAGQPISGATFAAYPDPDSDGKVASHAQPAATCTTGADGACTMKVPAGSYVLVQTSAPGGLEGIEPVPFTFASGGQVAAVSVVNYPPDTPAAPEAAASPVVSYTDPVALAPPVQTVDTYDTTDVTPRTAAAVTEQIGGTIVRVIRAPGDALRLLARDPKQAVAWTASLALLCLAMLAVRRRQLLGGLTAVPAFAFTGGGTPPTTPPRPAPPQAGPSVHAATAVLERPSFVAGAAPSLLERASARVVVATDHPVLAALATQRLAGAPSCDVVAVTGTLEALCRALTDHVPDVVVVDVTMPAGSEQDVCDVLSSLHPAERTVGLIPPNRAVEALITRGHAAGLGGLLAADEDLTNGQLGYAVRCVSVGKTFFGPTVQAVLLRKLPTPAHPAAPAALLTPRQLEVARLAADGIKRGDIAEQLFLSPATVKRHLSEVRARLGVTNPWDLTQLRARLDEAGLLDAPDHPAD